MGQVGSFVLKFKIVDLSIWKKIISRIWGTKNYQWDVFYKKN